MFELIVIIPFFQLEKAEGPFPDHIAGAIAVERLIRSRDRGVTTISETGPIGFRDPPVGFLHLIVDRVRKNSDLTQIFNLKNGVDGVVAHFVAEESHGDNRGAGIANGCEEEEKAEGGGYKSKPNVGLKAHVGFGKRICAGAVAGGKEFSCDFGDAAQFWSVTRMSTRAPTATVFWRWVLIVSEVLLGGYLVAMQLAGRHGRQETGVFLVVGILAFVAWVFLFFGSPFLVASQRWLAIIGWCIAAAAVLFSVL